jgi:hypothetical protein
MFLVRPLGVELPYVFVVNVNGVRLEMWDRMNELGDRLADLSPQLDVPLL